MTIYKIKQKMEIPEAEFIIEDIQKKYPLIPNITIRSRINREIMLGNVKKIRVEKRPLGRPVNVYSKVITQIEDNSKNLFFLEAA